MAGSAVVSVQTAAPLVQQLVLQRSRTPFVQLVLLLATLEKL